MAKVIVNKAKLKHNIEVIQAICHQAGVLHITPVVKVLAGRDWILQPFIDAHFDMIADSRIQNLKRFEAFQMKKMLLRGASLEEVVDVVRTVDVSLQSSLVIIQALNLEATRQKKIHQIMLMFDLGDLREGFFYQEDYRPLIQGILQCPSIQLIGIGTNLTCYGGVIPSQENLSTLVALKHQIEAEFNIELPFISGGNSSIFDFLSKHQIPKEINHLRIGEAFFFGRETAFGQSLPNTFHDVFTLEAKIIECYHKPSYPIGEMTMDSFGQVVTIEDQGWMNRAILSIGKQDIQLSNLFPIDASVVILGGSSDHLIVHLKNNQYQVGDTIRFNLNYPGLLQLATSSYIDFEMH